MGQLSALQAVLTDATCGFSCWYAREEVCRCSCGGRNHGALLDPDAEVPERIVKIDGDRYRLENVGLYTNIIVAARKVLGQYGWNKIQTTITYSDGSCYHYAWHETDKHAPVRVKLASEKQCEKWPEIKPYKKLAKKKRWHTRPYLLFLKVDPPKVNYCKGPCTRCDMHRMENWI